MNDPQIIFLRAPRAASRGAEVTDLRLIDRHRQAPHIACRIVNQRSVRHPGDGEDDAARLAQRQAVLGDRAGAVSACGAAAGAFRAGAPRSADDHARYRRMARIVHCNCRYRVPLGR